RIFESAGLKIVDVEKLPTHGGSLRVYGAHADDPREPEVSVGQLLKEEKENGLLNVETYLGFQDQAEKVKNDFLAFLLEQKRRGKQVAAYGAAAKGNTLLNFAGVKPDLLRFVCDAAPAKQGKFLPGSHIPILAPEALVERKPDYVVILPWNIANEVMRQNREVLEWGGRFVTAVPELKIHE
ncbi:SAM-dependent methyltransferase, partial [Candidatus Parcubacteria bacterium]